MKLIAAWARAHGEAHDQFPFRHPLLWTVPVLSQLAARLQNPATSHAGRRARELSNSLIYRARRFANGTERYPIGVGPFEQLSERVRQGELHTEQAERLAESPEYFEALPPFYVQAMVSATWQWCLEGDWPAAVRLHRLLLAAVWAAPASAEINDYRIGVDGSWLDVVAAALRDLPDGRLFSSAIRAGERTIAALEQRHDTARLAQALRGLAQLYAYPYSVCTSTSDYALRLSEWQIRPQDEYGVAALADDPAFQHLVLSAPSDSDGRLYAHEILRLNLRGLELVTLGACETALGRFDVADNLRGLPAAFFLAGAGAVVGTLWKVDSSVAQCFYTRLYDALRKGATKRDAFRDAQSTTRIEHPHYRDWGAFYFQGNWS